MQPIEKDLLELIEFCVLNKENHPASLQLASKAKIFIDALNAYREIAKLLPKEADGTDSSNN